MLKDNLVMLRNTLGLSQEEVAEKIGISRQAYAKWEKGVTIPDVEKCNALAKIYGVTVDGLLNFEPVIGVENVTPGPGGKHIFGGSNVDDAPIKIIEFKILVKYSLVGLPGLIPGTKPPCFFIFSATSIGLNVMDV